MSFSDFLEPVSINFTLKDHTYSLLKDAILKMDIYSPNAELKLDERKLASQLGISRTPIREALARLAQDGLVEIQPRKGVFICQKSRSDVLEMIITWAALESMAARLATSVASDRDLSSLRKFALKHSTSASKAELGEYSEVNIKFHERILELSGCDLLRVTADGLFMHMYSVRKRAMGESDRASRSVQDHMEIIEALESRDPDLAAKKVLEHTMRLHSHVDKTWTLIENVNGIDNDNNKFNLSKKITG